MTTSALTVSLPRAAPSALPGARPTGPAGPPRPAAVSTASRPAATRRPSPPPAPPRPPRARPAVPGVGGEPGPGRDLDPQRRLLVQPRLLPGRPRRFDHRADPGHRRLDDGTALLDRSQLPGGQVLAGPGPGPERGVVGHDQQQLGAVAGELAGVARVGRLPADQGADRDPVDQQRLQPVAGDLVVGD